jgi:ribonuclease HI
MLYKKYTYVFVDGSCENIGTSDAVAGLGVYFGKNHLLNVSEPVTGRSTNNVGEIQAAIRAIEITQRLGVKRLNIFTDSQFLIKSACLWMKGWKKKGWTLSRGSPVANQIDFKRLDSLIEKSNMQIKWSYIPAHKGLEGNEDADKLAKDGARKNL